MEKTFVFLKPDAVKRKLIGEIISRIEKKDYEITNMKMCNIDRDLAILHYEHVKDEPFFEDMIEYITSGPVVMMIIQGEKVIETIRTMVGVTSSFDSLPGTIRGDLGSKRYRNLIHASDCSKSFEREIERFFPELK